MISLIIILAINFYSMAVAQNLSTDLEIVQMWAVQMSASTYLIGFSLILNVYVYWQLMINQSIALEDYIER